MNLRNHTTQISEIYTMIKVLNKIGKHLVHIKTICAPECNFDFNKCLQSMLDVVLLRQPKT
ncbi:hypothetical protein [Candidatus Enterovibrio altilux]|uniref:hypothetical protein n=1 Tax=Candidatus Enterovibrio altilux TaxID=1927128 RepID=UPI001237D4FD|nr:hypothetical protein [Candidatus Enterovibrio luxaltus]